MIPLAASRHRKIVRCWPSSRKVLQSDVFDVLLSFRSRASMQLRCPGLRKGCSNNKPNYVAGQFNAAIMFMIAQTFGTFVMHSHWRIFSYDFRKAHIIAQHV